MTWSGYGEGLMRFVLVSVIADEFDENRTEKGENEGLDEAYEELHEVEG